MGDSGIRQAELGDSVVFLGPLECDIVRYLLGKHEVQVKQLRADLKISEARWDGVRSRFRKLNKKLGGKVFALKTGTIELLLSENEVKIYDNDRTV